MNAIEAPMAWAAQLVSTRWAIAILLTILLFYPLGVFLTAGWKRRWEEISTILDDGAKRRYLNIFHDNGGQDTDARKKLEDTDARKKFEDTDARKKFEELYLSLYGRKLFIIPMLLLALVTLGESYYVAGTLLDLIQPGRTSKDLPVAVAAIAGAYASVCWDLIARMQRRNLSRGDVCRSTLQLAMAILTGFAFSAFSNVDLAPLMAFAVGFIPLQMLAELLQKQVRKHLPATADILDAHEQITQLTGIDAAAAARIEDADITTVVQLAWCDPIQLTMRSNLQFIYVLDITSQALAWVYLKAKLKELEKIGLRGAIEIRTMLTQLQGGDRTKKAAAKASLTVAAKIVGVKEGALRRALQDISDDPMTKFLETIWQSLREKV